MHHNLVLEWKSHKFLGERKEDEYIFFNKRRRKFAKTKIKFKPEILTDLYIFVIDKEICYDQPVTQIGMTTKTYNDLKNRLPNQFNLQDFNSFLGIPIKVTREHPFPVKDRSKGIWTNLCRWQ